MAFKVQKINLSITDPAVETPGLNQFTNDFDSNGKKLLGISIKSGVSGSSLVTAKVRGRELFSSVPVDVMKCNGDYVAPDQRYFTKYPDPGNIYSEKFEVKVEDDGTATAYPYTLTFLLLLEVE